MQFYVTIGYSGLTVDIESCCRRASEAMLLGKYRIDLNPDEPKEPYVSHCGKPGKQRSVKGCEFCLEPHEVWYRYQGDVDNGDDIYIPSANISPR